MAGWLFIGFTDFHTLKNQQIDYKYIEDTLTEVLKAKTLWRLREVSLTQIRTFCNNFFFGENNCGQADIQEICKQFISVSLNFNAKKLTNINLKLNFNLIYILDIIWEPILNLKNYSDLDLIFEQSKIIKKFDEK